MEEELPTCKGLLLSPKPSEDAAGKYTIIAAACLVSVLEFRVSGLGSMASGFRV